MPLSHLSESERRCLERYVAQLANALGDALEEVVVFGSAARGEMWPSGSPLRSDIDVLVVTAEPVDRRRENELVDATYPLFLECGRQLGPQFRTREQLVGAFADAVARDGVTLWRRPAAAARRAPRFVASESVADAAAAAFAVHAGRIAARLPRAEIRHRGGTSIPGVLTSGDVDVHVRVEREALAAARERLSELYEPFHVDAWNAEAAFFSAPGAEPPVEVALTAAGSLDDLHHGAAWERLESDGDLRERYNALKREHEGGSAEDYDAAKRAFFREHFRR